MTKYFPYLTLSSLILFALIHTSSAQTVADNTYLNDKIKKQSQSLNYDDLTEIFRNNPSYEVDCLLDERGVNASSTAEIHEPSTIGTNKMPKSFSDKGNNSEEAIEVFKEYLEQDPFQSVIKFNYLPSRYGFDLEIHKKNKDQKNGNPAFEFEVSSLCQNGLIENQDEKKSCGSIALTSENTINVDDQNGDYESQGTKNEDWRIYYIDKEMLIANVILSYETGSYSWTGRKNGRVSFSQNYICVLTLNPEL